MPTVGELFIAAGVLFFSLLALAPTLAQKFGKGVGGAPSRPTGGAPGEFVPTNEWQVVQPDQAIPPGLWVRMDMKTGLRTARLLPKN